MIPFAFALVGAAAGALLAVHAPPPPPRWPLLPSIARVHVDVMPSHIVVTHDVTLPRGDWTSGDLTMHIAFGATMPFAIDAHVLPVADGELTALPTSPGESLTIDRTHRPSLSLLGAVEMAGVLVEITEPTFRRMLAPGNMALLRVRELARIPPPDSQGMREVLVRLGAANGNPLALLRVEVKHGEGAAPVSNVSARLCGKEADVLPLAVAREGADAASDPNAVAPVLITRHASDDLCIRFKSM